jgi:hypothetical protein
VLLIIGIVALDTSGAVRRQHQVEREERKRASQRRRAAVTSTLN